MAKPGEWWRAPLAAVLPAARGASGGAAGAPTDPPPSDGGAARPADAMSLLRSVHEANVDVSASASSAEDIPDEVVPRRPPQYLVFSSAGKLVYVSGQSMDADSDGFAYSHAGIMQALLALFAGEQDDELQSIEITDAHGQATQISVLSHPPLHVTCTSSLDAPKALVHSELARVHAAIVSLVSGPRLEQLFATKPNFDLRGLLAPMQGYLDGVVQDMDASLTMPLAALPVFPLDAQLRQTIAQTVVPTPDLGDDAPREVLYVCVLRHDRIVCLAHPKRHVPHTEDLALLLAMVRHGGACPGAEDAWAPMCLPHVAPHGFVFVYASQLGDGASTFVLVTGDRDGFARGRAWRTSFESAIASGCLAALHATPLADSADALGITGLRHYLFVSRRHAQCAYVAPPYTSRASNARLFRLYGHALAAMRGDAAADEHAVLAAGDARIPQSPPLRLQHYRTAHEAVLGWRTSSFSLVVAVSPPWLSKAAVASAANKVAAYVRRAEKTLFAPAYTF